MMITASTAVPRYVPAPPSKTKFLDFDIYRKDSKSMGMLATKLLSNW